VLGIIPGAVPGGRLAHVAIHADYYAVNPEANLDPGRGGLALSGAVVGGLLTGAFVVWLLDAPVGRWLHVAAVPFLLAVGLGKLAMVLGGSGQGQPSDLPWAVGFAGPGPWGSLAPAVPSHPSQAYEALTTAVVLVVVLVFGWFRAFASRDGSRFFLALGLWATDRALVASTWRDPAVLGPLRVDQLTCFGIALGCVLVVGARWAWARRVAGQDLAAWPGPGPAHRWRG
jgi:phosphatidylglycerol:prolipoprotein diacylglycerol transferase